jgi:cysteinyl-tRNA synthetase
MSLIHQLKELKSSCERMTAAAEKQQNIYFTVIDGLVALHQKHRVAKNFAVSDELRTLLNAAGVKITQGTDGYKYEDIPETLRGRPVNDTWVIE